MTLDTLGDDDDLGFSFPGFGRRRGRGRGRGATRARSPFGMLANVRPNLPARQAFPQALQVPQGGVGLEAGIYVVAMPIFTFDLAAALNSITFEINPQVNFRAQRMAVVVQRTGASALAAVPLLVNGSVGIKPIVLAANAVPIEIFATTAVDANILFPPTRPGQTYSMTLRASSAVVGADVMNVMVTFFGTAYQ